MLRDAREQKVVHLEAGCDGGVLVVRRLGVANEVIPAGEHLPGEGELAFVSIAAANICVLGHPADVSDDSLDNQRDFWIETRESVPDFLGSWLFICLLQELKLKQVDGPHPVTVGGNLRVLVEILCD